MHPKLLFHPGVCFTRGSTLLAFLGGFIGPKLFIADLFEHFFIIVRHDLWLSMWVRAHRLEKIDELLIDGQALSLLDNGWTCAHLTSA